MKNEEEQLERLIQQKKFEELTPDEKELVFFVLGSEEEYEALRKIETTLEQENFKSRIHPNPNILNSLKKIVSKERTESSLWHRLLSLKVPAYAAVLLVILFSGAVFLLRAPSAPREAVISVSQIKRDTIFVTRIDTLFREKIIYQQAKYTPLRSTGIQAKNAEEKISAASNGVSMKDKEELNRLLVSGSER